MTSEPQDQYSQLRGLGQSLSPESVIYPQGLPGGREVKDYRWPAMRVSDFFSGPVLLGTLPEGAVVHSGWVRRRGQAFCPYPFTLTLWLGALDAEGGEAATDTVYGYMNLAELNSFNYAVTENSAAIMDGEYITYHEVDGERLFPVWATLAYTSYIAVGDTWLPGIKYDTRSIVFEYGGVGQRGIALPDSYAEGNLEAYSAATRTGTATAVTLSNEDTNTFAVGQVVILNCSVGAGERICSMLIEVTGVDGDDYLTDFDILWGGMNVEVGDVFVFESEGVTLTVDAVDDETPQSPPFGMMADARYAETFVWGGSNLLWDGAIGWDVTNPLSAEDWGVGGEARVEFGMVVSM